MTFASLRALIAPFTPEPLRLAIGRARLSFTRFVNRHRSTAAVFERIYATNAWGGAPGTFCSGSGSEDRFTKEYCSFIRDSLNKMGASPDNPLTIVDLGCGDFRVGAQLVGPHVNYLGIDVVSALIERNQREFGRPGVEFRCMDIVRDDLPAARVVLIRQVLQHLSNSEIECALKKLQVYDVAFITEHFPGDESNVIPNRDKPHGPDTRLYDNSAVYLDRAPFSIGNLELCLAVPLDDGTYLKTFRRAIVR